jgi:hypothetical protein
MIGPASTRSPLLIALAQARRREAPMFTKWCELNGVSACPAAPADVARFVIDCAALGIERLWPAVEEISKMHVVLGLADPTLGGAAAAAINEVANIAPPRSWPGEQKARFKALPFDLQQYVAAHEVQRDRVIRRAQNEAANARQRLAALERRMSCPSDDVQAQKAEADDRIPHAAT